MDAEDLEMHDMTEERQEEERQEEEEEETKFDWDGYNNNLEDFSDNASQYEGNLPSTSYERSESNKDKTLKSFVRRKYGRSLKLDTNDGNVLELRDRTTEFPSGKALAKGGQALGSFGKSVVNVLKSIVPVLTPLLNILATLLSWAAKGIAQLASNLWALALFGVLLLYRWLQSKRK